MATPNAITTSQLSRLIGTADVPLVLDVRTEQDFAADPRLLPASVRRSHKDVAAWADAYANRNVAIVCQRGQKLAQGVAAWLRHAGATAEYLEGGFEAWVAGKGM